MKLRYQLFAGVRLANGFRTSLFVSLFVLGALCSSAQAKTYLHNVNDTVRYGRSAVGWGVPGTAYFYSSSDTSGYHTASLSLSDTVNFSIGPNAGYYGSHGGFNVEFTPKTAGYHSATVTVVGDSNTIYYTVEGFAYPEGPIQTYVAMSDGDFKASDSRCYPFYVAHATVPISITEVRIFTLTANGTPFSATGIPTLPFTLPATDTETWHICVNGANQSGYITGLVRVYDVDSAGYHDSVDFRFQIYVYPATVGGDSCVGVNYNTLYEHIQAFGNCTSNAPTLSSMLPIVNMTSDTIRVDSLTFAGSDAAYFSSAGFLHGGVIPPSSADSVSLSFTAPYPYHHNNYNAQLAARVRNINGTAIACKTIAANLNAAEWDSAIDSTYLTIPPDSTKTIAVTVDSGKCTYYFELADSSGGNLRVTNLYFTGTDASYFNFLTTYSLHQDTLTPTGWYNFYVSLNSTSSRTYNAVLNIETEGALTSYQYAIKAVPRGTSSVRALPGPEQTAITISPNPSSHFATITTNGMTDVRYNVLDLLGNVVASTRQQNGWRWDLHSTEGAILPAGIYFVRAEGTARSGEHAISTKRLVIE